MRVPSALNVAETTSPKCWSGALTGYPVRASQTRAVSSYDAVTTRVPSGLKVAEARGPACCIGTPTARPVLASHIRAVRSPDAVTTREPSGLKFALTVLSVLHWNADRLSGARVPDLRRVIVPTCDQRAPSELKDAERMRTPRFQGTPVHAPGRATSQIPHTILSRYRHHTRALSGLKEADEM